MRQLIVRDIPPEIVGALKRRAARHGWSAEAEHRSILGEALRAEMQAGSSDRCRVCRSGRAANGVREGQVRPASPA